uniref:Uncharacterized protein n=2 Tax=Micrurus TaxID=8634 RepID=A0A2D4MGW8_9SAUR
MWMKVHKRTLIQFQIKEIISWLGEPSSAVLKFKSAHSFNVMALTKRERDKFQTSAKSEGDWMHLLQLIGNYFHLHFDRKIDLFWKLILLYLIKQQLTREDIKK